MHYAKHHSGQPFISDTAKVAQEAEYGDVFLWGKMFHRTRWWITGECSGLGEALNLMVSFQQFSLGGGGYL